MSGHPRQLVLRTISHRGSELLSERLKILAAQTVLLWVGAVVASAEECWQ